jgi:O-antigen/teichoic acid export membrane protein
MACAPPIAALLAEGRDVVETYLLFGFLLLPLGLIGNILVSAAIGLERWRLVIAARLALPVVNVIGLGTLFLLDRLTVPTAALVSFLGAAAPLVPTLLVLRRTKKLEVDRTFVKEGLHFGIKAWIGNLSFLANYQLDQLLMILFVSPQQLGLYVVAVSLSGLSGLLTSALSSALIPRVARGDKPLAARAVRTTIALLAFGNAMLGLAVPWLLPTLFGGAFADATVMTWILLLASIPGQAGILLASLLITAGRPGASATAELIGLALTVPTLALLLPSFAGVGAAIASLVAYTGRFAFLLFHGRRVFDASLLELLVPQRGDWTRLRGLFLDSARGFALR